MKKLFLTVLLVAAVATSFVSCRKTTTDSDTHTQKFTLGTTEFDINNAIAIESIKDSSLIYNAIVLAQGDYVGSLGSRAKGAIIVFRGDFNGTNLVTAGRTKLNIFSTPYHVAAFITANGDLIGFISATSFDDGIPEGTYSSDDNSIIYVQGMSLQTLKFASSGEATVARNGDTYTIDMTGLAIDGLSGTPTMHYVGTMPNFDFPFPEE